ncbi:MAG: prohibitin family protein [Nitrososphaera sp.]
MKKLLIVGATMALGLMLSDCGFKIVDTGHRGVKTNFGKVVSGPLTEGIYFYNPLTSDIVELDTRLQRWDDSTDTYTKDIQQTHVSFTINYGLMPEAVASIYKGVGLDWSNKLVPQVVYGTLKEVVGQWDAVDFVSHRDKAQEAIRLAVKEQLSTKSIYVTGFEITAATFSKDFTEAVEEKVVATQNAIAEANRTRQKEELARQTIIAAEADAKSIFIRATALERNKELVVYEAVKKWNGQGCTQNCFGGQTQMPIPLLNLQTYSK